MQANKFLLGDNYITGSQWTMPFGAFKGERICDIDKRYLRWLVATMELREPLRGEIFRELNLTELKDICMRYRLTKLYEEMIRDYPQYEGTIQIYHGRIKKLFADLLDEDYDIDEKPCECKWCSNDDEKKMGFF